MFELTGGQAHEVKGYDALMELFEAQPEKLLGDRGYAPTRSAMTSKSAASSRSSRRRRIEKKRSHTIGRPTSAAT